MDNTDELFRRLEKEIKARKKAEALCNKKKYELKLANDQIKALLAEQEKNNKHIRELEQFAYIASHDLKAPLRAIENLASWIQEDCGDKLDEKSQANLALLQKHVMRMTQLIDGILQYSRAGRVDLEISEVNIRELSREILDTLNPGRQFTILLPKELPIFQTPKIALSQVFSNLLSNSIKYHHREKGTIEIGVKEMSSLYEFCVADDGPGIEEQYFEKIFEVFQTLQSKDDIESTGIGLSIVKKIVESQGGEITVESELDKGTVFRFTWPRYPKAHNAAKM